MPRYVRIPEPIVLVDLRTGEPIKNPDGTSSGARDSAWFFATFLLGDPKLGRTAESVMYAMDAFKTLQGATPGSYVEWSEKCWETIVKIVKEPSSPYNPAIAGQLIEFMQAIIDAPSKKPELPVTTAAA